MEYTKASVMEIGEATELIQAGFIKVDIPDGVANHGVPGLDFIDQDEE